MSDIVLKAENISKYYKLGQYNSGTLFKDIQSWYSVKRGKADPNAKIEENKAEYGEGFWALKDIDFEIRQGERVGVIGKNGAGKSTLLKIVSEITTPTTGCIKMKGRVASLLEVGTGFHPEMTGRENIFLNGAILGMKRDEIKKKLDEIISFSEIEEHIDTPVKRYSSGMYVRLAFAVAAHLDSEILIADEVLAVGDAAFQAKALGKMNEISTKHGRTVLFVSHNMSAVRGLCNSGILLNEGKIVRVGEINEVIDAYLGSPFNRLNETMKEKLAKLPVDSSFEFNEICISQGNKKVGTMVASSMPVDIHISYRVKKKETGLRVYFDLCDSAGELIFRSFNDERMVDTTICEEGEYHSCVSIPPNILGPTKYLLIFRAGIFNVRSCTGDGVVVPISVIADGLYNMAYPNDSFRGKLGLSIEWHNRKEEIS